MGRSKKPKKPSKEQLKSLYEDQSRSIRDVAYKLNLSPDTVHYWLKKYDIATRSKTRKSQLMNIPIEEIENKIKKLGIRGYARELGISEGTIRHYLKERKKTNA